MGEIAWEEYPNNRVTEDDTLTDVVYKISEGNVGAATVCMRILENGATVDPDCGCGLLSLLFFDTFGIYGWRIWVLYKDVCGEDLPTLMACIRAVQLGIKSEGWLHGLCQERREQLPAGWRAELQKVMDAVEDKLPNFGHR